MFRLLSICLFLTVTSYTQNIFPIKISENNRYFVTQQNKPFLYNAETGWHIFTALTYKEAIEYMVARKAQGFNTLQVMLVMYTDQVNRNGDKPFFNNNDFSQPNESYHNHVARVINAADSLGLLVAMSQPWLGCCGEGFGTLPSKPIQKNGVEKSRMYGEYLGKKFSSFKNLFWIMGGDNDPKEDRQEIVAMAEGLFSSAPSHQLITYHASPPHSSTDLFQYAPWLGFSFIYTYWHEKPNVWVTGDLLPHVYEAALREWSKSDVMPFVLGEAQYEGDGTIDNDMGNAQIIRRQAYWTILCGGAGVAYGSDIWNFPAHWRKILQYPGANQLKYFIQFFENIEWNLLIPDIQHKAVVANYGEWSHNNYVTTAVTSNKKMLVSYIPQVQSLVIDFGYLSGNKFKGEWFNPSNGKTEKVFEIEGKNVQRVSPPSGEDWVLLLRSID